ncbi:GbsR/MarR family transcriptional regulator [Thermococcus sp.]
MDGKKEFVRLVEKLLMRWEYSHVEAKVYALLLLSDRPLTISELAKETGLSRSSISTSLGRLTREYLVEMRKEGRTKYFTARPLFLEKFLEQPKVILEREVLPLEDVLRRMLDETDSEERRRKLEEIMKNLRFLEYALLRLIEIEVDELERKLNE